MKTNTGIFMKLSLGRKKRLKSRKKIERLFIQGERSYKFPIRMVYFLEKNEVSQFQITVSVPKKLIKKAVERNTIKRRMKEAFRLHQFELKTKGKLELMFIYTASEVLDYTVIENSVCTMISFLNSLSDDNNSEK
ncbi:MAG: ribonuclease P protein component [Weeksellaceae bacterium]|nr:ribonuclease P protein component [Weeksellaceae bacterium]